ncbi:hypothetical protein SprV_0100010200 [Sparganum proliferum]
MSLYVHQKALHLLSADGSTVLTEKTFYSGGPSTLEASSVPTPSDAAIAPLPQVETNVDLPPSTKPSGPCSSSLAGKHPDRTRSLLRSTSKVAPSSWII